MSEQNYQIPASLVNRALWAFMGVAIVVCASVLVWWGQEAAFRAGLEVRVTALERVEAQHDKRLADLPAMKEKLDNTSTLAHQLDEAERRHEVQDNQIHFRK